MKTLRLTLTDLELGPLGDTHRVTGEAWARYTREVRTTDGRLVVLAQSRKTVPATGVVEWQVLPNDDATVAAGDQGFGIEVGWDLYLTKAPVPGRGALNPDRLHISNSRVIVVTSADLDPVSVASKSPASPPPPPLVSVDQVLTQANTAAAAATAAATAAANAAAYAGGTPGVGVSALGDSITGPLSYIDRGSARSWFEQMVWASDGAVRRVSNGGHSGWTTTQLLATYQSEIVALAPDYCLDLSGTNDITLGDGVAVAIANKTTMWDAMIQAGIIVVPMILTPRTYGYQAQVADLNQRIRDAARQRGLNVIDTRKPIIDKTTGQIAAAYSTDGLHPNAAGAAAIGAYVWQQLKTIIPTVAPVLAQSNIEPANLAPNGLFLVDSNADGVPDGYSSGALSGHAIVDGTADGVTGNWAKMARLATDTGARALIYTIPTTAWAVGERIQLALRFKAVATDANYRANIYLAAAPARSSFVLSDSADSSGGYGHLDITVPAGTTSLTFRADITAGEGTLQVGQVTIRNLDRAPVATIINVSDNFNRANGALGTTSTGAKPWTVYGGATVTIASNTAGCTGGTGNGFAAIDGGVPDGVVQATLAAVSGSASTAVAGIAMRVASGESAVHVGLRNGSVAYRYCLVRRLNGTSTYYDSAAPVVPAVGDVVKLTASGNTITLNVNGVDLVTQNISDFNTITRHGLWHNAADQVTRWDNWSYTPA